MKIYFKDAKVGDPVWSHEYGEGKVINIVDGLVITQFGLAICHFTFSGKKYNRSIHPSLFPSEAAWREYVASTGEEKENG